MCLFVQTAAMTDGGTLGRKKSEEGKRGNKEEEEEREVGLFHEIED